MSIASDDHFYGYLVVEYPPQPKSGGKDEELRTRIFEVLRQNASAQYLDVLVLFFNRVYEARLRNRLKSSTDVIAPVKDFDPFEPLPSKLERPLTQVEDHVRWLWAERKEWAEQHPVPAISPIIAAVPRNDKGGGRGLTLFRSVFCRDGDHLAAHGDRANVLKPLEDSLTLSRMQIASLPMVEVIRSLMNFGIEFKPDAPGLPSVLVIGGPGSGKDSAARLVALFAKGYTFGSVRTINMAALRPQALVGAMLQGVKVEGFTHDAVLPVIKEAEEENPGTVILDELNSLDVDQQGILLRVLENKEVAPLGAPEPNKANFLCVGVMNETPEDLMKEDELRTAAARSNLFGQLLGTVVDEMFRRARRLRPDLYYRMQRYGVINLPTLHDRRDDTRSCFTPICRLRTRLAGISGTR